MITAPLADAVNIKGEGTVSDAAFAIWNTGSTCRCIILFGAIAVGGNH